MNPTIESKVAFTILERPIGEITLEGTTYDIPAPTTATIIAVSALISTLPEFDLNVPDEQLPAEVLKHGEAGKTLAQIAATLMLGQKRIEERRTIAVPGSRKTWSWRKFKRVPATTHVPEFSHVTSRLLANTTTGEMREIIFEILKQGGLDDFFILTTSLHAKSITTPTREVGTTAHGHS